MNQATMAMDGSLFQAKVQVQLQRHAGGQPAAAVQQLLQFPVTFNQYATEAQVNQTHIQAFTPEGLKLRRHVDTDPGV
jgi:hypothetical protein